jgi:hypothetical protein
MRILRAPINPTSRIAAVLHTFYLVLLPLVVVGLVYGRFVAIALMVIILSKWRMFAVRPRYWLANIRANMVDIIVGFSVVSFMSGTKLLSTILIWGAAYSFWLIVIKPRSSPFMVGAQAFIAQGLGLVALFTNHNQIHQVFLVALTWLICFSSSRHFLVTFEDNANRSLSHIWALFAAEMALILGHWSIVYSHAVPQIALILSLVGYALGVGYYLHKTRGLRANVRRQLIIFCIIVLVLILLQPDWQAQTF